MQLTRAADCAANVGAAMAHILPLAPPFSFTCGASGDLVLDLHPSDGLSPLAQELPFPPSEPADALRELQNEYLTPRLDPLVSDVAASGLTWNTSYVAPSIWVTPFPAASVVEAQLPPLGGAPADCGFREVILDGVQATASSSASLLRKPQAAQGTREYVRGSLGAMPFAPGGEALEFVSTAVTEAAEAAATGAWLAQLESGAPVKAVAPGLPCGLFGAWAATEEPTAAASTSQDAVTDVDGGFLAGNSAARAAGVPPVVGSSGGGAAEPIQKVQLDELFSGIWLAEEEEEEPAAGSVCSTDGEAESPAAGNGRHQSVMAQLAALPDDADMRGAVANAAGDAEAAAEELEEMLRVGVTMRPEPTTGRSITAAPLSRKAGADDHEWAVRSAIPDLAAEWAALKPRLAHYFPFELDTFQKEAVWHLEQGNSVFVAAHTSAGKTVVAEYAFALASQHCTRAIYTSPIKTISNQKFRDFSDTFEVGLLTGDVSIKPESSCLIMTTEILRSMLYKGADIIRDIEWVIFDEVHYVNDAERGVVWEEVIIMLPDHVNLVLLSATVPNVMEFADWVGRTKRKKLHVTGTLRRPVPLEHTLFYNGQLYTIGRGESFLSEGVAQAKQAWKKRNAVPVSSKEVKDQRPTGRGGFGVGQASGRGAGGGRGGGARGPGGRAPGSGKAVSLVPQQRGGGANSNSGMSSERTAWLQLIGLLQKQALLPVVVFCFSKKRCDNLANSLSSLDMTTPAEKSEIHVFCEKSLSRLKGGDRTLPQILRLRQMLKKGMGVHHAGLLPIMKEVVEMLFCRGLLRVLFCTETFAMGVNAPARTVVFQSLRKHDGKSFRTLLPGEYTQMAGRAGRRGLDPVGTVIVAAWDDVPDEGELKKLLTGRATRLESQFRLTYSMILNLMRVEDLKVEDMLKRSFLEFHAQKAAPEALVALQKGRDALVRLRGRPWPASLSGATRPELEEYCEACARIEELTAFLQDAIMATRPAQQALVPGRAVLLADAASGMSELGVILGEPAATSNPRTATAAGAGGLGGGRQYHVLCLHRQSPLDEAAGSATEGTAAAGGGGDRFGGMVAVGKKAGGGGVDPGPLPRYGELGGHRWALRCVSATQVQGICRAKIRLDADAIMGASAPQALATALTQLQRLKEEADAAGAEPELLDPVSDLKVSNFELVGALRERQALLLLRAAMPCHRDPGLGEMYAAVRSEMALSKRIAALAHQLSDANLAAMPEFHQRIAVLRQLDYLAEDNTVQIKGRVACEINSGDELVATELIFSGVLTELSPEEAVALLSALVFQEKSDVAPELPPALAAAVEQLSAIAWQAGAVQAEAGLPLLPDEFQRQVLKFGLTEVVYEWARGTPFNEICGLTDVMEGSIVRAMVRLDETCREFRDAARVMGNTALFQQMEAASAAIKRDVIFAASLYVA